MIAIFKKDLTNYFKSPIAYITLPIFLVICGLLFVIRLSFYSQVSGQAMMNPMYASQINIYDIIINPQMSNIAFLLLFFAPLFTMRLFSEEKKLGTLELLFTYPLTEVQLIAGKLLSCFAIIFLGTLLTLQYPFIVYRFVPDMDWSYVLSGYIGVLLLTLAFISVGMWISALTDSQVVASFSTFGALMFFWIVGWFSQSLPNAETPLAKVLSSISILDHFENFTKGIVDTNDLVFYVCFIFFFLYLTYAKLLSRKWQG